MHKKPDVNTNAVAPEDTEKLAENPDEVPINYEVSLPSFRDGVSFTVHPLNFGGFKAVMRAGKTVDAESIATMLHEAVKREFPEVKTSEVDKLELDDFSSLLKLVMSVNGEFKNMDFTTPTSTKS